MDALRKALSKSFGKGSSASEFALLSEKVNSKLSRVGGKRGLWGSSCC